jgi:hypothetical protein
VVRGGADIGPGVGKVGAQFDGATIGGDRFVETAQCVQCVAEIAVGLGKIRFGGVRLPLRLRCFLVFCQLHNAEIAQRRRHVRLDEKRTPWITGGIEMREALTRMKMNRKVSKLARRGR